MTKPAEDNLRSIFTCPSALLPSESIRVFNDLEIAIRDHIDPRNVLEEAWTAELRDIEWEMRRLRRFKSQIVSSVRPEALRNLLSSISDESDDEIEDLARRWVSNKAIRNKITRMLDAAHLDESAIDAEAYRLSLASIAYFDRQLTCLARRRDAVIRQIEDYRAGTATPLRTSKRPGLVGED